MSKIEWTGQTLNPIASPFVARSRRAKRRRRAGWEETVNTTLAKAIRISLDLVALARHGHKGSQQRCNFQNTLRR
jgi:uncharacterized protein (DUF4415 family)